MTEDLKTEIEEAFIRKTWFPKTELDMMTFRKLRSLKTRQIGTGDWGQWLKYLSRDVGLEPTLQQRVQEGTFFSLLPMWMKNFAENLPDIRRDGRLTIADMVEPTPVFDWETDYNNVQGPITDVQDGKVKNAPKATAIVVGRGPSLFKNKHCEMLADAQRKGYNGVIVASDGALIPLLEAGVVPHIVVTVDGSPVIKKFFEHDLVQKHGWMISWVLSVTVNHEVYLTGKKAGLIPKWFNPMFDDWRQNESWTKLQVMMTCTEKHPLGVPRLQAGGNAGACAWVLCHSILKRAPVALIGIDFGYPEGTKLEDTQYYSSILREAGGNVAIIKESYKEFFHPTFKQKAYVDLVFYTYRQAFLEMQQITAPWFKQFGGTINCTEGGTLFGQEITCMPFKQFLEEHSK